MNSVLLKYLLNNYLKTLFKVFLFFYSFGIIINLFEEIEFFKNLDVSILIPLLLTILYIPGLIIDLLPFIIFVSSMKFLVDMRNNKDLLTFKVFGYSNFKIFIILAATSFLLGWLILFFINPVTSAMAKYYEQTKSDYSKDINHLVTFNNNGLWIKENLDRGYRIVTASKYGGKNLSDITIFNFNKNFELINKINSKSANIEKNEWLLKDVSILEVNDIEQKETQLSSTTINSIYTYDKIINLFKNFQTLSFVDLLINYKDLVNQGYNKIFLNQSLHSMLSMPFFLFIMTSLASILVMNTLKKSNNLKFIFVGIIFCVIIFYLKDLSVALGQTNRISLTLAIWIPVIVIGIISSIGILQINEK
jgi:lipopolysaccharide export system permease protein